jgi:hypothetical protein
MLPLLKATILWVKKGRTLAAKQVSENPCGKARLLAVPKMCVGTGEKKQQVPPLRYAPVGMTVLLHESLTCPKDLHVPKTYMSQRIVIPTGA